MRDHTWDKWVDLESRYNYELGETKHARIIRSVAETLDKAQMSGLVAWIAILQSKGVDVPSKIRESEWERPESEEK